MNEKILLIDDDPAVRRMLSRVLAEENFAVVASDGWEHLGTAGQMDFDLALLDLSVDPAKGLAVSEGLRRRYPMLPVIIMAEQAGRLVSKSIGRGNLIVEKSLDLAKLLQIIRSLLPQPADLDLKKSTPTTNEGHHPSSTPAELAETSGGKNGK